MEWSECEFADDADAEQLATAHPTSTQPSGGGSAPAMAKVDRLAADGLQKKHQSSEETTEERAVWLQSYIPHWWNVVTAHYLDQSQPIKQYVVIFSSFFCNIIPQL